MDQFLEKFVGAVTKLRGPIQDARRLPAALPLAAKPVQRGHLRWRCAVTDDIHFGK
jgi:hypothetical protein